MHSAARRASAEAPSLSAHQEEGGNEGEEVAAGFLSGQTTAQVGLVGCGDRNLNQVGYEKERAHVMLRCCGEHAGERQEPDGSADSRIRNQLPMRRRNRPTRCH